MAGIFRSAREFDLFRKILSKGGGINMEITSEGWDEAYVTSEKWGDDWRRIRNGEIWPKGIQVWQGKLSLDGKLAVPESLQKTFCGNSIS